MEENLQAANAEVQNVNTSESPANSQTTETATEVTNAESKQDVTQTQAFAHRLKEATEQARVKALDEFIASQGYEYNGKPIRTYAEYQQAQAEIKAAQEKAQFQQQNGFDPDAIKPLFEQWKQTDPDFQELRRLKTETSVNAAIQKFNEEFPDIGIKTVDDLNKLPNVDKITQYVQKGLSLNDAYKLANYNDLIGKQTQKAQQEAIEKITANGQSSPGSLASGGEGDTKSIFKMSKSDFQKLQEEVLRGERKSL